MFIVVSLLSKSKHLYTSCCFLCVMVDKQRVKDVIASVASGLLPRSYIDGRIDKKLVIEAFEEIASRLGLDEVNE